jgi:deoxyadenosine/deoxycytidine kinase
MPRIFSVDGNIGSGKSTLIKELEKFYAQNKNGLNICFIEEPVNMWNTITDTNGKTILEHFYNDPKKYAFPFQMMAYISRLTKLKEALEKSYNIIFTERSVETDFNVFAKMLYDTGVMNEIEYKIYKSWFYSFLNDIPKVEYIYLRTEPTIAHSRVQKRNRDGETIELDYLIKCHDYHNRWLDSIKNKCVIDYNNNENTQSETISKTIEAINEHTAIHTITLYSMVSKTEIKYPPEKQYKHGVSYIIWNINNIVYQEKYSVMNNKSSIYMDYTNLLSALQKCNELNIKNIIVQSPERTLIDHLQDKNVIVPNNLLPLYHMVLDELYYFTDFDFTYVQSYKFNKLTKKNAKDVLNATTLSSHPYDYTDKYELSKT